MRLSRNFTLEEFTRSPWADQQGIDNSLDPRRTVHAQIIENLSALVQKVLQPLRDRVGPINVTSGYRTKKLNDDLNGSTTSQHLIGQAADIVPKNPEVSRLDLIEWALWDGLPFDQLICYTYKGHLHFSHRPHPRLELRLSPQPGQYLPTTLEEFKRRCHN
ncbi:MAG: peptidase M15 [Proteobacteria bacterium]|nr:peptidase M15 [Pseudomonadota bacterium]MBU1743004.1 peptidase M15 [Pseudomonadota bacterium]